MLKRVSRFILDNAITPPIARVTELTAEINAGIAALEGAAEMQVDGGNDTSGGVATRREKARALRTYLKDVARVGRSLDRDTYPGLAEHFVLPDTRSYPALVAAANAMIAEATPLEAAFIAHGLPATFLADTAALLAAFEAGSDDKWDGLQTQVEGTSTLHHRAMAAIVAATKLDAIIRAHFRDDPVKLDVWTHARHVQADPESEEEGSTPPSGGSGSGTTSGGEGGAA
jgi:hypothetical protein